MTAEPCGPMDSAEPYGSVYVDERTINTLEQAVRPSISGSELRPKGQFPKDRWVQENGCWIRVHQKPRRALFTPMGTQDGPLLCDLLVGRTTLVDYEYPKEQVVTYKTSLKADKEVVG